MNEEILLEHTIQHIAGILQMASSLPIGCMLALGHITTSPVAHMALAHHKGRDTSVLPNDTG